MGVITSLNIFGFLSVSAGLICYAMEERSHWWTLGFVLANVLGSIYGFLQGAWPFGMVEGLWAVVAARRWRSRFILRNVI